MRYWLSNGDGQQYGPYEVEDLRTYAAEGRLDGPVQLCAEGSSRWVPASSVVSIPSAASGLGHGDGDSMQPRPPTPPLSPSATPSPPSAWTPVSLASPILATLCCCLPAGICAIVYATKANAKGAIGDIEGAKRDQQTSKRCIGWAVALGFVVIIFQVIVRGALNQRY